MNRKTQKNIKKRVCLKLGITILTTALLIGLLSHFISGQALDELKHSLSLWTIIALVVVINLVGFICFLVLFAVYQWIRGDLKAQNSDILKD